MHCSIKLVREPWNGPALSMTRSKSPSSAAVTWSRSSSATPHLPSVAASASSGSRRRPPSVTCTPRSRAASRASREPNTPLAPTIRTWTGRSVDIVEQDLLMDQGAGERVSQLQPEQEARPGDLAMGDPGDARGEQARQPQPPAAELEKIMVADEGDPVVERLDPERHPEAAAEIFLEAGRAGEALGAVDDL